MTTRAQIADAVTAVRGRSPVAPRLGMILGSGLGAVADDVANATAIRYTEIPHFPLPTAKGHQGRLVLGTLENHAVAVLQGRSHLYEGYTAEQVAFPVRVLAALGARILIVTNAAGGLTGKVRTGDLMLITDHINFSGTNPLVGPNDDILGPRFPDMSEPYDPALRELARKVAREEGITLRAGVYVGVLGPSYETPAELEMLRGWGADAVGMSTVTEVIAARHAGLRVLGVTAITNGAPPPPRRGRSASPKRPAATPAPAAPSSEPPAGAPPGPPGSVTHDAVLAAAREIGPRLSRLIRGVLRALRD
jgi:purine-nucleoside phosphorylase